MVTRAQHRGTVYTTEERCPRDGVPSPCIRVPHLLVIPLYWFACISLAIDAQTHAGTRRCRVNRGAGDGRDQWYGWYG